jgi:hypothetical protein
MMAGAAAADRGIVGFDEFAVVHIFQGFVTRQNRLFPCRSHKGEDQPVTFLDGVPGLAHPVPELAAVGLAGLFQATALGVELPAMIAAADAVFLDLAVIERVVPRWQQRAWSRTARPCRSRNRIRSSPSALTFRGTSVASAASPIGCQ